MPINTKKKKVFFITMATLAILLIAGMVVASTVETGILSIGFTLVKSVPSTAMDMLSVSFSLVKPAVSAVSDTLSASFTLLKSIPSAAIDTVSVGFNLIKAAAGYASNTILVGFTLVKAAISTASDILSVGFTLVKEAIGTVFATITTSFYLIPGITPTPTPTPTPVSFTVSALSSCPVVINQTAQFNATVGGADATPPYTYNWVFGDGIEVSGQSVSHMYPAYWRSWYAVVIVTDSVGHIAQDSVQCCVLRTKTDETIDNIDDSAYYMLLNAFTGQIEGEPVNESTVPDFLKFAESTTTPYTNIVGNLFFMILFSAFFLMIWIRQENIMIPSTIGIIAGGYLLGFAPPEFRLTAILFVSLSIFGIIYMLLKERS